MNKSLLNFPEEVRSDIASISSNAGVLNAQKCLQLCERLAISVESLMIELLPIAAAYSVAPISSFNVGAVVRGIEKNNDGMADLYLGANLEFIGQALCHSVHAEQAAISNAWLQGETGVTALAVSAPPCGHCRQFLYEVSGSKHFPILLPKGTSSGIEKTNSNSQHNFDSIDLSQLLPAAFGPVDLGCEGFLMAPNFDTINLNLLNTTNDPLVAMALKAANLSYAPYTKNYAGCALQFTNGETLVGRYAENAAYNPSLHPFCAALSQSILANPGISWENIERAILVEQPTNSSQKHIAELLLNAYTKNVILEYFSVTHN